MEVVATCLHWSPPVAGHTPAAAQALPSILPSLGDRSRRAVVLLRRSDHRSALFSRTLDAGLCRGGPPSPGRRLVERTAAGGAASPDDGFDDDEFARTLDELARSFEVSDDDDAGEAPAVEQEAGRSRVGDGAGSPPSPESLRPFAALGEPPWEVASPVPPEWPHPGAIIPASVERQANSVELPLSLRMIKRKKQCQEGLTFAGESAYCSVKKAFSSMVFIIRELQSYTLQLRELLFYQDLQGILIRVQTELNASFVWLFQRIFSQTPTLMVYVMILLANFTVYSVGNNAALAAPHTPITTTSEAVSAVEEQRREQRPFDQASVVKTYSISGRSASVGGGGGGGGNARPVAGPTDGGEHRQLRRAVVPSPSEEETAAVPESEETRVWNAMVEEATRLQPHINDGVLDQETMQRFVSPVTVQIPPDVHADYLRTELSYQLAVAQEPNNPLLLSNYAQFLFLVVHDHDRYHYFPSKPPPLFCLIDPNILGRLRFRVRFELICSVTTIVFSC